MALDADALGVVVGTYIVLRAVAIQDNALESALMAFAITFAGRTVPHERKLVSMERPPVPQLTWVIHAGADGATTRRSRP